MLGAAEVSLRAERRGEDALKRTQGRASKHAVKGVHAGAQLKDTLSSGHPGSVPTWGLALRASSEEECFAAKEGAWHCQVILVRCISRAVEVACVLASGPSFLSPPSSYRHLVGVTETETFVLCLQRGLFLFPRECLSAWGGFVAPALVPS